MSKIDINQLPHLSRLLCSSHPNGFRSYDIIGERNIGKSTYALICAYWAFRKLGYTKQIAWERALHSICFTIQEVIDFLKYAQETDIKEFLLIWDDVRVFASGKQYFLNMNLVDQLSGALDTVKILLNNMVLTSPSMKGTLGIFNTFDSYQIEIHQSPKSGNYRMAKGYKWSTSPAGQRRVHKKFRDNYNCRLPNWVYALYMKRRKQITFDAIYNLDKIVKKRDEKLSLI